MLLAVHWLGLDLGGVPALLWLQYYHHYTDWWYYLIVFGIAIVSSIMRASGGGWRNGNGWFSGGGNGWGGSGQSWDSGGNYLGANRYLNPLAPRGPRLTPPPMPDTAVSPADLYQAQLDSWMGARGLDPNNSEHVRLALAANPYNPSAFAPAAQVVALPAAIASERQQPPQQAQELLWLYDRPWWIAGGWALDLWLGRQTREHADIEIAIPRRDQLALRSFMSQFRFTQVMRADGSSAEQPLPADALVEPPQHELHARRVTGAGHDPLALMQCEVLLNEIDGGVWRYRRDQRVSLPLERLGGKNADGLPYLAPEVVLLYKAGLWRDGAPLAQKDDADFSAVLPHLPSAARYWLREAIATAHPGHPWLLELNTPVFGN